MLPCARACVCELTQTRVTNVSIIIHRLVALLTILRTLFLTPSCPKPFSLLPPCPDRVYPDRRRKSLPLVVLLLLLRLFSFSSSSPTCMWLLSCPCLTLVAPTQAHTRTFRRYCRPDLECCCSPVTYVEDGRRSSRGKVMSRACRYSVCCSFYGGEGAANLLKGPCCTKFPSS